MTNEEIKSAVTALFPTVTFDETGEFLNILIDSKDLRPLIKALRYNNEFDCDFLFCLTCIDWKTHLTMVYHLLSKKHKHAFVVKAKIADINNPEIETVSDIWQTANFHEREVYDLFGVKFLNHPDLRRIMLDEDWEGHPLRKSYVDENMISI
ncbi:MAG: dehydrogenase (ubiquinone) 30 kDa subunit [Flavipsychrobacter sp.]|jgi:NADH:ubiquinone oxidoreductase subunit C|nr:dehydrogenase (ubiquinone) 30 kDa subunit [Flavipsychrobacter sp.]